MTELQKSGKFIVRIPKSLHEALVREAESEGVSLNALAIAKLSISIATAYRRNRPKRKVADPADTKHEEELIKTLTATQFSKDLTLDLNKLNNKRKIIAEKFFKSYDFSADGVVVGCNGWLLLRQRWERIVYLKRSEENSSVEYKFYVEFCDMSDQVKNVGHSKEDG